ncbi:DUF2612 domain-containing protein [Acinetobacter beijerinckii]|uniref:DUF2612 domain-containing protein n=1 Tax=Acinetobacter beijerinckii TaxID=262668 RepID=UPI002405510E|nr:DUF2612 domain-containing protein [Acinetobacter beijerinckii]
MSIDNYLKLITSQHRNKPKYQAMIEETIQPIIDIKNSIQSLPTYFDLETATGDQLATIAKWVGAPTTIDNAIPLPLFGFEGQPEALPFGELADPEIGGYWRESGQSGYTTGTIETELLRNVIKAQIYKNSCICSLYDAIVILDLITDDQYTVFDSGLMWIGVGVHSSMPIPMRQLMREMLPKPAGVGVKFFTNWFESFGWTDQPDSLGFGELNDPDKGGYWIEESY